MRLCGRLYKLNEKLNKELQKRIELASEFSTCERAIVYDEKKQLINEVPAFNAKRSKFLEKQELTRA